MPKVETAAADGAAAVGQRRPVPRSLQADFASALPPPPEAGATDLLRRPHGECQGQVTAENLVVPLTDGAEKSKGPGREGQASSQFARLHNSFPPEFKARPGESWKDYWRTVEFWLASEGAHLPAAVRGSRLMQQLKERAAKIVAHLTVEEVAKEGGVELIRSEMEKSPIIRLLEHKEVDRKRQKFMKLSRSPGESLESFINRASIYRHENDSCQNYKVGSHFYLGHLLDAAKLTRKDEALVKTAAGGLKDENRVVNALLELADQLEGQPGCPIGQGEPNLPDEDQFLVQKGRGDHGRVDRAGRGDRPGVRPRDHHGQRQGHDGKFRRRFGKKWKQVFHAILEDDSEGEGSTTSEQEGSGSEARGDSDGAEGTLSTSAGSPPEHSDNLPAEVYAQEYKAKKKVNELKQMRQFFQKGTNSEKTKAWVKEQQKKEPCFLCGKLGHWSQECQHGRNPHAVHVTSAGTSSGPDQWDLLQSIAGYMESGVAERGLITSGCLMVAQVYQNSLLDHEAFWTLRELHSSLILDIGCMKSVAGTKWVNQHIQRLKALGRWMKATKERESFRFGDGHEVWSEFSFAFEATLLGVRVLLRLSVVPGDCPPLLSKPACTQLGIIIDTENHTVSSRKLKIQKYGLSQTFGGHYALPIAEFADNMLPLESPEISPHVEAIPVYLANPVGPSAPSNSPETLLRSWVRHDRQMTHTLGPGRNGPPWHLIARRVVFNSQTEELLVDEQVHPDTRVRRALPRVCDTRTVLFYRVPGSEEVECAIR